MCMHAICFLDLMQMTSGLKSKKKNHLKVLKQAEIRNLRWSHMDGTAALLPLAGWWQQQARMCHKLYSPRPYKAFTSNFRILC